MLLKCYCDAMQRFTHSAILVSQMCWIIFWESTIFKIMPSGICPCYPHEVGLANGHNWCDVACGVLLRWNLSWVNKRSIKIASCHRELKYRGSLIEIIRRVNLLRQERLFLHMYPTFYIANRIWMMFRVKIST